jgi:hypothetical protein
MGFVEEARLHALFLASVQRKDGMFAGTFAQNFDNTGRVGGPVPLEIDQVGLAVWTMSRLLSAADGCEPIERSLQFLIKWRDPINHLPLPANEDDEFAFTQGSIVCKLFVLTILFCCVKELKERRPFWQV